MRPIVLSVLLTVAGGAFTAADAQSVATFRSAINLVPISASVRDRHGRPVMSLSADDFEVYDKGERRGIVDFQVDANGPVSLAVLLDISGSMRIGPKLELAGEVLRSLSAALVDGRDEIGLFTFAAALREEQPFTIHPAQVRDVVSMVQPFGTTSLYDAIAQTARRLAVRAPSRRAIIVVSDGVDTSSALTPPEVSGIASSIDVPVYVVAAVPRIDHEQFEDRSATRTAQSTADLRDLAQWTGGDLLWVDAAGDAATRVGELLTELRHQYLIAIESSSETDWRPLDLRVRQRNLTVRARSGYFPAR